MGIEDNLEAQERLLNEVLLPKGSPIVWRVTATWANQGRKGETDSIVVALDAITALQLAWRCEDPDDLRDVSIEWLTPECCIIRSDEESTSSPDAGEGNI